MAGARYALLAALASAAPVAAQIVPPGMAPPAPIVPPAVSPGGIPTGTVADPLRVYGDDAPALSGLDILAGIGLDVIAAMTTEYNDNVARLSDGSQLSDRYRSKGDWSFRPSVGVSAGRPLGRQQLFLNANIGRDFYARNTLLDRNRFGVNGGMAWSLGTRCGGRLQGGYIKRGTQFGTFEEVIPSTQERVDFLASANCRTATGLSANLSYNRKKTTNHTDDPEGEIDRSFADVKSHGISGGIGYPVANRGQIGLQGNWTKQDFPNQPLATGGVNGSEIYGVNLFGNYRVGSSLNVNAGLGKSWVSSNVPMSDDFSGLVWNLGVNYSGPRIGVSVSTGRSVNGSSGASSNYTIGKFFNTSVNYRANNRLSFAGGIGTSDTDYRGIDQLPETQDVRSAKMRRYFMGADYRLNRIVAFSLDFNHANRSSNPGTGSYKANTVGLTARASF
ncbi:outer membrane beta-barrel protein [Sandaracinobacter sp. RS1-74]|uniref:outer membrane beta-barrel protein n=1 Tax=Sandaracinobacteroides sayramensis TaxID=2913411 RepID=UPI001EDA2C24|nr:outer membrane beta-barrel protein [Sandaracinobacteroides sayramensis]MCG2840236.1 outer membrane beta-barrel protein [Sandaracinobacteroides sayramensis]